MKKRPYLLLELLIALFFLSLCAVPLVQHPLHMLREEIFSLEQMELCREAEVSFAKLCASIIQGKIPLEKMGRESLQPLELSKEERQLLIHIDGDKKFKKEIALRIKGEKKKEKEEFCLLYAEITFTPLSGKKKGVHFRHKLLLKKNLQNISG